MVFYGRLSYIVHNTFRMFEFYYFMKELHEYIQCTNPITCRFYHFFMPIENVLFSNNKDFEEVQKFFTCHCSKKITVIYFVQSLSGDFQEKKNRRF